jgi:hypothetical protein
MTFFLSRRPYTPVPARAPAGFLINLVRLDAGSLAS